MKSLKSKQETSKLKLDAKRIVWLGENKIDNWESIHKDGSIDIMNKDGTIKRYAKNEFIFLKNTNEQAKTSYRGDSENERTIIKGDIITFGFHRFDTTRFCVLQLCDCCDCDCSDYDYIDLRDLQKCGFKFCVDLKDYDTSMYDALEDYENSHIVTNIYAENVDLNNIDDQKKLAYKINKAFEKMSYGKKESIV